jgi:hypothetical protein
MELVVADLRNEYFVFDLFERFVFKSGKQGGVAQVVGLRTLYRYPT